MITRDDELNIDFGLHTTYDNNKYRLMTPNNQKEYQIGGLICEYMRLAPTDIKEHILSCVSINKTVSEDTMFEAISELQKRLDESQPPVISTMVTLEFMNVITDWFKAVDSERMDEWIHSINTENINGEVKDFIFDGTGYSEIGGETVLQLLLSCYCAFANTYILTKSIFWQLVECGDNPSNLKENTLEVFTGLYGMFLDFQHIDYRIILTEKGFESLYTVKSSLSLLVFEMAHCINSNATITRCKNCGQYFVPDGRSDAVYCSYPSRKGKGKTCKEIGAQITRSNKEKTDIVTREYRKVYMRYKMAINRHPEDQRIAEKFAQLTREIKIRRGELMSGETTIEEILDWLTNEF